MTNPIRVLIVDDHAMVRRGLAAFLKAKPDLLLVGEASNGGEAISLCERLQPDVVLMDLMMPGMGGAEATQVIVNRWPAVRVIALTSFGDKEMVREALAAGALSYLLKNVSAEDLAEAIRAASGGRSTLAAEAVQALVQPEPAVPVRRQPHPAGTRSAGAHGERPDQPGNRRAVGGEPLHRQGPCQQCALQAGGIQSGRGRGAGGAKQAGVDLTVCETCQVFIKPRNRCVLMLTYTTPHRLWQPSWTPSFSRSRSGG